MSTTELRILERAWVNADGVIHLTIGKPLKNHNSGNRNPHWSVKAKERKAWHAAMYNAIVNAVGDDYARGLLGPKSGLPGAHGGCVTKRRVTLTRLVPSKRNYIRDTFDNLRTATKELRDALKGLGLIRDDSDKWCDMTISQGVTDDGTWRTEIHIEPA